MFPLNSWCPLSPTSCLLPFKIASYVHAGYIPVISIMSPIKWVSANILTLYYSIIILEPQNTKDTLGSGLLFLVEILSLCGKLV